MMFLTAKVDLKKIMLVLAGVSALVLALIGLLGRENTAQTSAPVSANDSRVRFLEGFGWEVVPSPKESNRVLIPKEGGEAFERYNALQKDQGYDLSEYAGKKVMRYVYEVRNHPEAKEGIYATVLMYKDKVIGGDVTNSAPGGKICGFKMPVSAGPTAPEMTHSQSTTESDS